MTAHPHSFPAIRGIVPPYLLRHLADSDEPMAAAALATLTRDRKQRRRRVADAFANTPTQGFAATVKPAATLNPSRLISDAGNIERLPGKKARSEGESATNNAAVDEAYDGFGATWELFNQAYGRNSIDNAGLRLLGSVHYGEGYQNAFWNGTRMVFGDGDGEIFGRFTASLDVIGHELTHGVVEHTAALVYSDQSGALNESVADVFGVLVAQHQAQQSADVADWLIGGDLLLPGVKGTALRNMLHPGTAYDDPRLGKDPQPSDMSHYVQTTEDNGGVHYNSGIPNRAFALAATTIGGFAWERAGQIWYDVLTGSQIRPDCDFGTFASLTISAARARYGKESVEAEAVGSAWRTVGVGGAAGKPKAPTGDVSPQTEVVVRRSGGFAGLASQRRTSLADLPQADRKAWQGLLSSTTLPKLAADSAGHPDAYLYGIHCADAEVELVVSEPSLPQKVKALLDRFLADD
jgi:hypothetical protein